MLEFSYVPPSRSPAHSGLCAHVLYFSSRPCGQLVFCINFTSATDCCMIATCVFRLRTQKNPPKKTPGPVAGDAARGRHVTAVLHVTTAVPADLADPDAGLAAVVAVHAHAVRPDLSRRRREGHEYLVTPPNPSSFDQSIQPAFKSSTGHRLLPLPSSAPAADLLLEVKSEVKVVAV